MSNRNSYLLLQGYREFKYEDRVNKIVAFSEITLVTIIKSEINMVYIVCFKNILPFRTKTVDIK